MTHSVAQVAMWDGAALERPRCTAMRRPPDESACLAGASRLTSTRHTRARARARRMRRARSVRAPIAQKPTSWYGPEG